MARRRTLNDRTMELDFEGASCAAEPVKAMEPLRATAWFDGACQGNPGEMGMGGVVRIGDTALSISERGGFGTNNEAEYKALILVLQKALEHGVGHIDIYGDSQLVINQVGGNWKVNSENLRGLWSTARELKGRFAGCRLQWVRRTENTEADALSTAALDVRSGE